MNLSSHIVSRVCGYLTLDMVLSVAKTKLKWPTKLVVDAYLRGDKYKRDHKEKILNLARLYIAYDNTSPGREAHEIMNQRGWLWSAMWMKGTIHPQLMWEMCQDHPDKFPVEKLLIQWEFFKYEVKQYIKNNWHWYVLIAQFGVICNGL